MIYSAWSIIKRASKAQRYKQENILIIVSTSNISFKFQNLIVSILCCFYLTILKLVFKKIIYHFSLYRYNLKVFILPRVAELFIHKEKQRGCPLLGANRYTHIYISYICVYILFICLRL